MKELELGDDEHPISISLGGTVSRLTGELSLEEWMGIADEALYKAKSLGRDRVELAVQLA